MKNSHISSKTKSGLYWNVALKIAYEIFRFATSIVIARILDPKDFGIVSIATMVIYYSNSFTNFGFNQALVQRKDITQKHVDAVFTFDLTVSVIMATSIFLSAGAISVFFNSPESKDVIRVLSVVFILTTLHDLPYVLLRRDIEFKVISVIDMIREVSMSLITLMLAYLGFSYWSIVWGHIIPLFFAAIYLLYKVRSPLKITVDYSSIRELFHFSMWSFIQMQIYFLSSRIDRIIIGKFLDMNMLGLYEKSKSLSQMPSESLGDKINAVLFSSFSRAQDDKKEIARLFNKSLILVSVINFPIYFGLFSISEHFVLVLLGEKWSAMIPVFQIMAVAGLFASINGLASALAVGAGHYRNYTIRFGFSTVIFIILAFIAVDRGIEYVAVTFVAYSVVLFQQSFVLLRKEFNFRWSDLFICLSPAFICGGLMLAVLEMLKYYYFYKINASNMIALICVGMAVFSLLILIYPSRLLSEVRRSIFRDVSQLWKKICRS